MPSLAETKRRGRRDLHRKAAVPALYYADPDAEDSVPVKVRAHNKIDMTGDLQGDYGQIIDGVDRLIFHEDDLNDPTRDEPLVLARNGEVVIPDYGSAVFSLDQLEPLDGLGEIIWAVAKLKQRKVA